MELNERFHTATAYIRGRYRRHTVEGAWARSLSGCCGEENSLLSPVGTEPQTAAGSYHSSLLKWKRELFISCGWRRTSVHSYQISWCRIPEGSNFRSRISQSRPSWRRSPCPRERPRANTREQEFWKVMVQNRGTAASKYKAKRRAAKQNKSLVSPLQPSDWLGSMSLTPTARALSSRTTGGACIYIRRAPCIYIWVRPASSSVHNGLQ